jgi:hypothetical protein
MDCYYFLGLPQSLGTNELRGLVSASRALMSDESVFPKLTSVACPDAAGPSTIMPATSALAQPVLNDSDVAGLRRKFQFLKDFSDDFIRKTPLEALLKTETTAIKIKEFERNKAVGDKLASNREYLADTFYKVAQGQDNRWDKIHDARFLPSAWVVFKMFSIVQSLLDRSLMVVLEVASCWRMGHTVLSGRIGLQHGGVSYGSITVFRQLSLTNFFVL